MIALLTTTLRLLCGLTLFVGVLLAAEPPGAPPHPLAWDAVEKVIEPKPGETVAAFTFKVTNTSDTAVEIVDIQPSCGCTVAELPSTPWKLASGEKGSFRAVVDFRGKHGKFAKSLYVLSTAGTQRLGVVVDIPETEETRRVRNQQLALADRQAVFRSDCASCHAAPAAGKKGEELYRAACAICHEANPRANMVPDLASAREPRDAAYWAKWITEGREQTLMPAFAEKHGGPLTNEQIASLVSFLNARFPTRSKP